MAHNDGVELRTPDRALFLALLPVARSIFSDTFSRRYDASSFERFCDEVYSPGGSMDRDFEDGDVHWQVAVNADAPIGYAKVTPLRAPAPDAAKGALEFQQLYVLPDWHGTGVSDQLMRWGINDASLRGASEIYLTVFEHNERAKRFYSRYGFSDVGHCTFKLGDRVDDDRIWMRTL